MTNYNLTTIAKMFADPQHCKDLISQARYPDGVPVCPACNSGRINHALYRSQMRCRDCGRQFSLKHNTLMEDSPLDLGQWLLAIYAVDTTDRLRLRSLQALIGVSLKTAWLMKQRIHTVLTFTKPHQTFEEKLKIILSIPKDKL